jgi:hypothetical protein
MILVPFKKMIYLNLNCPIKHHTAYSSNISYLPYLKAINILKTPPKHPPIYKVLQNCKFRTFARIEQQNNGVHHESQKLSPIITSKLAFFFMKALFILDVGPDA